MTAFNVDDTQSRMAKQSVALACRLMGIGTTMGNGFHHGSNRTVGWRWLQAVEDKADTTH
jgi:hypothetical protein